MSNVSVSKLSDGSTVGYIASQSYFECSTAAATATKEATSPNNVTFSDTSLVAGVTVHVKFTYTNTYSVPLLKVGTSTAKYIQKTGSTLDYAGTTPVTSWAAGSVVSFTYNGTYWIMNSYLPSVGTVSINSTTITPNSVGQVDITSQVNALITAKISGDDATAGDILYGKKAHVNGIQVTGTIATKTSSDVAVSGPTVTVSPGYYSSAVTKTVATASHPAPSVSVSSGGLITATHTQTTGYVTGGTTTATLQLTTKSAQTYTPTTTDQTISSGQYLTGVQTIKGDANLVAGNIKKDVVIFNTTGTLESGGVSRVDTTDSTGGTNVAITGINEITLQDKTVTPTFATTTISADSGYTGLGSVTLNPYVFNWMGPDAEVVKTVSTRSLTLSDTSFASWTPTTTATSILATSTATTFSAAMTTYEYFLVWEYEFIAAYTSVTPPVNSPQKVVQVIYQALFKRPSNYTQLAANNYNANVCVSTPTMPPLSVYYDSSGNLALGYSASYGIYAAAANATFSNSTSNTPTVTVKYPSVSARCNSTYMTLDAAGVLSTASTVKMKCTIYRIPYGLGVGRKSYEDVINLYKTPLT